MAKDFEGFSRALLCWFGENARDLPWRREYSAYSVWVAETMLCQTQVERVVPYYLRWMERFPELSRVAMAPLEEVLLLWEGLGYYRRAAKFHEASRRVLQKFRGEILSDYRALRALPGIGPYIAEAILSIAYNEPYPAVDANVRRVVERLLGPKKAPRSRKTVKDFLAPFLLRTSPRLFNQALMDLGALVCTPRKPRCARCPLASWCGVKGEEATEILRKRPQRVPLCIAVVAFVRGKEVLVRKHQDTPLFTGLFELPWEESDAPSEDPVVSLARTFSLTIKSIESLGSFRHAYSRYAVSATLFLARVEGVPPEGVFFLDFDRLSCYPFPSLHRKAIALLVPFMERGPLAF
ncbi:MAG: A/G-specific adenine glycosylase [Candidatus Caldatribacteriaceae bacterium]